MRITVETVYENADEAFVAWWIARLKEQGIPVDTKALELGHKVMLMSRDPEGRTRARTFYQIHRDDKPAASLPPMETL